MHKNAIYFVMYGHGKYSDKDNSYSLSLNLKDFLGLDLSQALNLARFFIIARMNKDILFKGKLTQEKFFLKVAMAIELRETEKIPFLYNCKSLSEERYLYFLSKDIKKWLQLYNKKKDKEKFKYTKDVIDDIADFKSATETVINNIDAMYTRLSPIYEPLANRKGNAIGNNHSTDPGNLPDDMNLNPDGKFTIHDRRVKKLISNTLIDAFRERDPYSTGYPDRRALEKHVYSVIDKLKDFYTKIEHLPKLPDYVAESANPNFFYLNLDTDDLIDKYGVCTTNKLLKTTNTIEEALDYIKKSDEADELVIFCSNKAINTDLQENKIIEVSDFWDRIVYVTSSDYGNKLPIRCCFKVSNSYLYLSKLNLKIEDSDTNRTAFTLLNKAFVSTTSCAYITDYDILVEGDPNANPDNYVSFSSNSTQVKIKKTLMKNLNNIVNFDLVYGVIDGNGTAEESIIEFNGPKNKEVRINFGRATVKNYKSGSRFITINKASTCPAEFNLNELVFLDMNIRNFPEKSFRIHKDFKNKINGNILKELEVIE